MSENAVKESILQPTTLQEAINIIKFLNTSHKQEVARLKEAHAKQAEVIKKLESTRKKELEFLSSELQKYEVNLALRTESVAKQIAEKDLIIQKQAETIEELNNKLKLHTDLNISVPEINILVDSNSDSGVALETEESNIKAEIKTEVKATRKCSRKFGDTISFLRRVDFSPMKYKPCNREGGKKKDDKKNKLQVPDQDKRALNRQYSNEKSLSDDERPTADDSVFSDGSIEPLVLRPNKMNDSMNNHFSDDGSEDTSEEIFDKVMTRSNVRRSVKANPKYKKINRSKSKLLEQVKVNIVD
ncbi:uncharacterized protein LOC115440362 [Manduca sexta]|uniref:Uncharacterized protein n=1 Tax=Manduca sexta TaxID=7130 RepID=A0A921YUE0_MANSE|nr:uncharacterized protein LOC115440362 [Manduca sexta]KAG6445240.1 hypothetical protein O3G_MSEX003821 [Manduca sexta]KAG6445241.1 hypothetical protein O3G_MSEX003821 [Manduca sexta]